MGKIGLSNISTGGQPGGARSPSPWPLSEEQEAILTAVRRADENLIIEALAGTGKTSTLVEVCKDVKGTAAFCAFNKAIAVEIERKLAAESISSSQVKAATFHSVGFSAWRKHAPNSAGNVRGEKLALLAEKMGMPKGKQTFCRRLVSLAKQTLIGVGDLSIDDDAAWLALIDHHDLRDLIPEGDYEVDEDLWIEEALAWSLKLLRTSIAEATTIIDFDDMIYMPLYENLRFWQYDWVLIDEAQDTNYARREISKRILRPGGRLVAVGDRLQAIYGFTGADHDALDLIERDFRCKILPLTTTYRCAKDIVKEAQRWAPTLRWREGAPDGRLTMTNYLNFLKTVPQPTDAILCRNTKPLVELAFFYLRQHIGCHVEGREIGQSLVGLIRKFKNVTNIRELTIELEEFLSKEKEKLIRQHKEDKLGQLVDRVETILVLAETFSGNEGVFALTALIESLFQDSDGLRRPTITLSTIHKAKGREWDTVYLLGRHKLMPSGYAKQDWQLQQEANLEYVAVTRAKTMLADIVLPEGGR